MRAATARRARADRPPRPDPLHHHRCLPHEPRRGVPPRCQRLCAPRAPQRARAQLTFNNNGIGTYTEQRRLRAFGRPFPAALLKHAGRVVDFQDHPNRKPAVVAVTPPLTPARSIPPRRTVLSSRDAPRPRRAQPESRSTGSWPTSPLLVSRSSAQGWQLCSPESSSSQRMRTRFTQGGGSVCVQRLASLVSTVRARVASCPVRSALTVCWLTVGWELPERGAGDGRLRSCRVVGGSLSVRV